MKMKKAPIVLLAIFPLAACLQIGGVIKPLEEGNMYHGNGAPSDSLGRDFSHYYDENSRYVYEKKDGKWMNRFTIGSSALYESEKSSKAPGLLGSDASIQELKNALSKIFKSVLTKPSDRLFKPASQLTTCLL